MLVNGICLQKSACTVSSRIGQECEGVVITGECYNCKPAHCVSSRNGLHCDICQSYYVLVGGMCYKPVKYDDVNCNLMDLQSELCTGCNQNYMLDSNNYCVKNFMVTNSLANNNRYFDNVAGKFLYRDRFCRNINYNTS